MNGNEARNNTPVIHTDAQGAWWISQPCNTRPEANDEFHKKREKGKKRHGNRKLQHFKQKCRDRKMTEEQITELVDARQGRPMMSKLNEAAKCPESSEAALTKKAHKRKRHASMSGVDQTMTKSLSQLSVSQPSQKKRKNKAALTTSEYNYHSKSIER